MKRGRRNSNSKKKDYAPPELVESFFGHRVIVMNCIGKYLTLEQLSTLLQCSKNMYSSFSTTLMKTLRECQRKYGLPRGDNNRNWVRRCIKLHDVSALSYVLDRALAAFVAIPDHNSRYDDTSQALVCATAGFGLAFKLGYEDVVEFLLVWNMNLHKGNENSDIHHLFYHSGSRVKLKAVLPDALVKGSRNGNGTMVRRFIETHCPSLDFSALDVKAYADNDSDEETKKKLRERLLVGCVCNGDTDNYPFFEMLCTHTFRSERLVSNLLMFGNNPKMLYQLVKRDPFSYWDFQKLILIANQNLKNPIMLQYVIETTPKDVILEEREFIQERYVETEGSMHKAVAMMQLNLHSKKGRKFVVLIQKRLEFFKLILERFFNVDWEKFRPVISYSNMTVETQWGLRRFVETAVL